ncbi:MAG TPA: hypothetical protein VLE93_02815 [Candidatus Saccharimonadales bacterium]|nr:hypothetical protein [Candidatus Saccharimonadales bacterium]
MKRSALLWLSHVCTVLFGIGSVWVICQQPAGQSVSWYLSFFLFCVVALAITVQETPSPETLTRREVYRLWSIVAAVNLTACVTAKLVTSSPLWTEKDKLNFGIYGTATLVVVVAAWLTGKKLTDPLVRGWCAFALKDIPQGFLAWLGSHDPKVLPIILTIVVGLVTILLRLIQFGNPLQLLNWTREKQSLALAEYFNFISWAAVGVVWTVHYFA